MWAAAAVKMMVRIYPQGGCDQDQMILSIEHKRRNTPETHSEAKHSIYHPRHSKATRMRRQWYSLVVRRPQSAISDSTIHI